MAVLFHGVVTLFMTFVLRIFLVVYIILTYTSLNAYTKHMEGVPQVIDQLTSNADRTKDKSII